MSHNPSNLCASRQIFPDIGQDGGRREERGVVVDVLDVDRHGDGSGELRRSGVNGHHGQVDGVAGFAVEGASQGEVPGVRIEMKLQGLELCKLTNLTFVHDTQTIRVFKKTIMNQFVEEQDYT